MPQQGGVLRRDRRQALPPPPARLSPLQQGHERLGRGTARPLSGPRFPRPGHGPRSPRKNVPHRTRCRHRGPPHRKMGPPQSLRYPRGPLPPPRHPLAPERTVQRRGGLRLDRLPPRRRRAGRHGHHVRRRGAPVSAQPARDQGGVPLPGDLRRAVSGGRVCEDGAGGEERGVFHGTGDGVGCEFCHPGGSQWEGGRGARGRVRCHVRGGSGSGRGRARGEEGQGLRTGGGKGQAREAKMLMVIRRVCT
mmetsp:Transcript_42941/g.84353  ORF Transcript_42941/g.84353 Transcript_42941/m.84353 type:complete len:249 (+) Transcript_42941:1262-2008(+)